MSNTSSVTMINLAAFAQHAYDSDIAAGADPRDYSWNGDLQTIPVGMAHNPEGYAQQLRIALPVVNTLRLTININSFNADGSLDAEFERFLSEAAKQGFKFVFNYGSGDAQRLGEDGNLTLDEMRTALNGSVHDKFIGAWTKMLDWLDANPDVNNAVYALEAMNEPAGYGNAQLLAPYGEMVKLYGQHMVEFAELVRSRSDAKVMIDGWGWSQNFNIFAQHTASDGSGLTVLDQIRAAAGSALVWSAHLYPQWATSAGQSVEGMATLIKREYGILGNDDLIITETNGQGGEVNNITDGDQSFWMTRAWEALVDQGIGIGWYPGAQTGGSSFVSIDKGASLKFWHPDSYAHGMNAFLLGYEDPAEAQGEKIIATLIAGPVMKNGRAIAGIDGIGFAAGHGGNDSLVGIDRAVNMLYGGKGNDLLYGMAGDDDLFGQAGNDILNGGAGDDVLMGGDGSDILRPNSGADLITGGRGADTFVLDDGTADVITDFFAGEGDVLKLSGKVLTVDQIDAAATLVDYDKDGAVDDTVVTWTRGEVVLLNYKVARPDGTVDGTDGNDLIQVNYKDLQGDQFRWQGNTVDAHDGDDTILGSTSADTLLGSAGNDSLEGKVGNDLVFGGDGIDVLIGGAGNDELRGDAGDDRLSGGEGNDTVHGGLGNDSLTSANGIDWLFGGDGADTLDPGTGTSSADGGAGNDRIMASMTASVTFTMTGGDGADAFEFRNTWHTGAGNIVITDFEAGIDTIKFDGLAGFAAIMKNNKFGGFTDVGDDCVLKFADDTYRFANNQVADLI